MRALENRSKTDDRRPKANAPHARRLTDKELQEWRARLDRIAAGHRRHYWGTL